MYQRRLIIAILVIVLIGPQLVIAMTSADKWARYQVGAGNLSCEFPSEPQQETKTIPGLAGKIYLCTCHDSQANTYGAMFMGDVGVNLEKLSLAQLDDFYKATAAGLKQGMLETLGKLESTFEVTESAEKQVRFVGSTGREKDYTVGPAKGIVRMGISGHAMFMGFATITSDVPDKVVEEFFASFQLSKSAGSPGD